MIHACFCASVLAAPSPSGQTHMLSTIFQLLYCGMCNAAACLCPAYVDMYGHPPCTRLIRKTEYSSNTYGKTSHPCIYKCSHTTLQNKLRRIILSLHRSLCAVRWRVVPCGLQPGWVVPCGLEPLKAQHSLHVHASRLITTLVVWMEMVIEIPAYCEIPCALPSTYWQTDEYQKSITPYVYIYNVSNCVCILSVIVSASLVPSGKPHVH